MSDKTILIVDDEIHILQMLKMNMKARGYKSLTAENGEEALNIARNELPDLILLDVMLPGMDGIEVCRILKDDERTKRIPILMVSAKSEGKDKVSGFRGGANDYISKPFNLEELYLRIEAALKQVELLSTPSRPQPLVQGNLVLDLEKYLVTVADVKLDMTPTEFRILSMLLKNNGKTLSREELIEEIFDLSPSEIGRTLDVHLRNIRKKLNDNGVDGCVIKTIRGQGFRIEE